MTSTPTPPGAKGAPQAVMRVSALSQPVHVTLGEYLMKQQSNTMQTTDGPTTVSCELMPVPATSRVPSLPPSGNGTTPRSPQTTSTAGSMRQTHEDNNVASEGESAVPSSNNCASDISDGMDVAKSDSSYRETSNDHSDTDTEGPAQRPRSNSKQSGRARSAKDGASKTHKRKRHTQSRDPCLEETTTTCSSSAVVEAQKSQDAGKDCGTIQLRSKRLAAANPSTQHVDVAQTILSSFANGPTTQIAALDGDRATQATPLPATTITQFPSQSLCKPTELADGRRAFRKDPDTKEMLQDKIDAYRLKEEAARAHTMDADKEHKAIYQEQQELTIRSTALHTRKQIWQTNQAFRQRSRAELGAERANIEREIRDSCSEARNSLEDSQIGASLCFAKVGQEHQRRFEEFCKKEISGLENQEKTLLLRLKGQSQA